MIVLWQKYTSSVILVTANGAQLMQQLVTNIRARHVLLCYTHVRNDFYDTVHCTVYHLGTIRTHFHRSVRTYIRMYVTFSQHWVNEESAPTVYCLYL